MKSSRTTIIDHVHQIFAACNTEIKNVLLIELFVGSKNRLKEDTFQAICAEKLSKGESPSVLE